MLISTISHSAARKRPDSQNYIIQYLLKIPEKNNNKEHREQSSTSCSVSCTDLLNERALQKNLATSLSRRDSLTLCCQYYVTVLFINIGDMKPTIQKIMSCNYLNNTKYNKLKKTAHPSAKYLVLLSAGCAEFKI